MALINKQDPKKIFASQAPSQDVPAEFNNYERGWDESRKNNGKPTIKQFNKLQQLTDEKILWMHQNGSALPFDETIEYADGAVVVKDGELQQWNGEEWKSVIAEGLSDTVQTFNTPEAGVDPVTGVAEGAYFNVRSSNDESYVDEYQNVGGSAVATGKSYPSSTFVQEVKVKAPYFFATVSDMVVATNILDGMIVGTKGYHNIFDDGGSIYLISSAATDYSIPLANGLHAVFRDTFDIRKFGIISSPTLDQTTNLLRMRNYADTRVYEINFLDFDLMSPKCVNYTSARGSILKGLYFHYPHKWKNAKFYHDKTEQLYQGACPLQFTPKVKGSGELIELENVRFDIYIADHKLVSGEGDGRLHGFYAGWHPDYPVTWPASARESSGYNFKADRIYAETPAVTSTFGLGLWFNNIDFSRMYGDYIAYYSTFMANNITATDCQAVYRDDLHAAGRLLVTNQFQLEPEVDLTMNEFTFAYTLGKHIFNNLKCSIKSTGAPHMSVKYEKKGVPTIEKLVLKNIDGGFGFSATASNGFTVLDMEVDNVADSGVIPQKTNKLRIRNSPITRLLFPNSANKLSDIVLEKCNIQFAMFYTDTDIDSIKFIDCEYNASLSRTPAKVKRAVFEGGVCNVTRLLEADWQDVVLDKSFTYQGATTVNGALFLKVGTFYTNCSGRIMHSIFKSNADLLLAIQSPLVPTQSINAVVQFNDFAVLPTFQLGSAGTLQANFNSKQLTGVGSITYDPPSLPNATQQSTTVSLTGAKLGDNINVAFDKALSGTRMWGEVTSANVVTVYHRNDTGATVDLPSGILSVKLV